MQLEQLKKKIENNEIPKFLVLFGEEYKIIESYVKKIQEQLKLKITKCDNLENAVRQSKGFFGDNLFVIKDNELFSRNIEIDDDNTSYFVCITQTIDKRVKLYKKYEDSFVEFEALKDSIAIKRISQETSLNDLQSKTLFNYFNTYSQSTFEIEKISSFSEDKKSKIFDEMIKQEMIEPVEKTLSFSFSNCVTRKDTNSAYKYLDKIKQKDESVFGILALLYINFRNLASIQFAKNPTPETTGLSQPQIFAISKNVNVFKNHELLNNLKLLSEIDFKIKTGDISDEIALDYFLLKYS